MHHFSCNGKDTVIFIFIVWIIDINCLITFFVIQRFRKFRFFLNFVNLFWFIFFDFLIFCVWNRNCYFGFYIRIRCFIIIFFFYLFWMIVFTIFSFIIKLVINVSFFLFFFIFRILAIPITNKKLIQTPPPKRRLQFGLRGRFAPNKKGIKI